MYKAILYDLDGTLVDSIEDLADALNALLLRLGQAPTDVNGMRELLQIGSRELLMDSLEFVPEGLTPLKLYQMFNEEYAKYLLKKTQPFPDIRELLRTLAAKGMKQAVISNKSHELVEQVCSHFFDGFFDVCIGTIPHPPKPDPTMLRHAMDSLRVKPSEIIYLGDTQGDMEAAAHASVRGIWVDWGYGEDKGYRDILRNPMDLLRLLEGE